MHDDLPGHRADSGTGESGGQQRDGEDQAGRAAKQGCKGLEGGVDIGHIILSMRKEGGCSHIEHSHIDESGQAHGNHHVGNAPAKDAPGFLFAARDNAMLSERGVQVDDMWHDRGTNDSHREEDALRPTQPGDNGMKAYLAPIWMGEECLNQVTERNHPNQGCDYRLQRAEPAAF